MLLRPKVDLAQRRLAALITDLIAFNYDAKQGFLHDNQSAPHTAPQRFGIKPGVPDADER
jgi:hypothetical protein